MKKYILGIVALFLIMFWYFIIFCLWVSIITPLLLLLLTDGLDLSDVRHFGENLVDKYFVSKILQ